MTLSSPNMDQLPFPPVPVSFLSTLSLLSPSRCPPCVQRCVQCCSVTLLSSFSLLHVHLVRSAAPVSFLSSLALLSTSLPTPCAALLLFLSCLPSFFFPHHCPPRVQRCSCFFPVFPRSSFHITAHPVCSAAPVSFLSSLALLSTSLPTPCAVLLLFLFFPHHCPPRVQCCSCFFPVFPRSSFHITAHPVCSAAPVSFLSSLALLSTSLPTPCAALLLFLSCLPSLFFPHHCPPRVQCCSEWRAGVEDSLISISLSVSFRRRSTPSQSFQFSLCLLTCSTACSVVPSDDACHLPQRGLSLPISLPSPPRSVFTR